MKLSVFFILHPLLEGASRSSSAQSMVLATKAEKKLTGIGAAALLEPPPAPPTNPAPCPPRPNYYLLFLG